MDWLTGAAGAAITMVVAADIFRSLLVPRANARFLRLGPVLGGALFSGWQAMAERIEGRRLSQTMRASLAPLMLVMMLAIWVTLLTIGFGLMFWADRANFSPRFRGVGDAIYAAGCAFSTLGVDAIAIGSFTRIGVVACSVAGLAIVTVVATFLISIQTGYGRRETLVLRLESHVTLPPAGIAILETYAREAIVGRLGAFFEAWELWTAEIAISHRAFPILLFFRSNDSRCEWLAALGAVMDAAALLDVAVADPPHEASAGAHFVLRTGARVLSDMARQFAVPEDGLDLADAERFQQHCDRLTAAGYTLVDDRQAALHGYVERRRTYAANLVGLARRLHIIVDERNADDVDSTAR